MTIAWSNIFDKFGTKVVTRTDKAKSAYVPNAAQVAAIIAAGISPSTKRPAEEFKITILNDKIKIIGASFYHAERVPDPTRSPEPRMGHSFISSRWLQEGDRVVIGNIGEELFAAKLTASQLSEETFHFDIAKKASRKTILERAKRATGKPPKKIVTRDDYQRDPYVVMAAFNRSNGRCEMPNCSNALFLRGDDTPYLEVHHVIPLGEGGEDTYANVAALCPHCHREQHFGKFRRVRRATLARHIATLV